METMALYGLFYLFLGAIMGRLSTEFVVKEK